MRKCLVAIVVGCAAGLAMTVAGGAATPELIIDSTSVDLTKGEDDKFTAKVVLLNPSGESVSPLIFTNAVPDDGCVVSPAPDAIQARRRVEVTLTFTGCEVQEGANLKFTAGEGDEVQQLDIVLGETTESDPPNWDVFVVGGFVALGLTVTSFILVQGGIRRLNFPPETAQPKHDFKWIAKSPGRFITLFGDGLGSIHTPLCNSRGKPLPADERVGWNQELDKLGTDWSFKESWIANVSLGTTALIALLAATDVLEAVLGEKPEAAIGMIALAAGASAFLVGLGPLLLKAVGRSTAVPTTFGAVAAGMVVLFGVFFQVASVTYQVQLLPNEGWVRWVVVVSGCLTAALMAWYGWQSLVDIVKTGITALAERPDTLPAWIIARANTDRVIPQLQGLDPEERTYLYGPQPAPSGHTAVPQQPQVTAMAKPKAVRTTATI